MRIKKTEIKTVHKTNSPSGPLFTITYKHGGQDHQVPIEYVENFFTDGAKRLIYAKAEGRE